MIKNTIAIAALLYLHFALFAQSEKETQPLFNDLKVSKIGFMASPYYQYSEIDGAGVSVLGIRGAIIFNDKLSIGGFYSLSVNEFVPISESDPGVYMDYRVGGGYLEYTLRSDKLIHLTFPLFIGGGEVEMDWKDNYSDNEQSPYGEEYFFTIEPSAYLEINLHKYIRLSAGVGYRIINKVTYRNLDQSDLCGLTGTLGLKIGLLNKIKVNSHSPL